MPASDSVPSPSPQPSPSSRSRESAADKTATSRGPSSTPGATDDMEIDAAPAPTSPPAVSQQKSKASRTLTDMWSSARATTTTLTPLGKTRVSSFKQTPLSTATQLSNGISFAIDTAPAKPLHDDPISPSTLSTVSLRLSTRKRASFSQTPEDFINLITANDAATASTVTTAISSQSTTSSHHPKASPPTPPPRLIPKTWKHIMIVEVSVRVPKAGGSPFNIFRERLFSGLDFLHLHGEDATIAFLPKVSDDSKDKPPMLSIADFPTVQCSLKRHYFSFNSPFAFATVNSDRGRRIFFSARMGFNSDPSLFLAEMEGDLEERHCSFKRKHQQAMDVDSAVVLWGAPQFMCPRDGKVIIDQHLIPLEKEMMQEDPHSFPAAIHAQPWPEYELVLEQPVDFERTLPGEKWTPKPPGRRAVHIKCAKSDTQRFVILVAAAKSRRIWLDEFGKCFPSEILTKQLWEEDADAYQNVLSSHMAIMFSYAKSYVPGLLQAREEFTVTCLPDAEGNIKTHTVSIRSILQDVDIGGVKVFQCVLRSDGNRRYQVYYKAKCPVTSAFVKEYLHCPAAQIYYYLLKRGVKRSDADRVVKRSFSHEQLALIRPAKYNASTKLCHVAVAEEDMDIIMAAQLADGFVESLANLPSGVLAHWKAHQTNRLRAAENHDPAMYDFENGQSVTSIHAGNHHPQFGSGASIGASKYSVVSEGAVDLSLDEDDEVEDNTEQQRGTVCFAMEMEDGTVNDVLQLPTTPTPTTTDTAGDQDETSGDEDEDMTGSSEHSYKDTLAYLLWMAAPNDIRTIEQMIDQLELEFYEYEERVESFPRISELITPEMRAALHADSGSEGQTIVDFLNSLRHSLYETHGKNDGTDPADPTDSSYTTEFLDPSFALRDGDEGLEPDDTLRLPGLSGASEHYHGTDSTGLPQGSTSNTPPRGQPNALHSEDGHIKGTDAAAAQPGGGQG